MAEKKKDEFSYGSAFLPEGERKYSVIRWGWRGLNNDDKIDTGQLTDMRGMVCDPPYMEAQKLPKVWIDFEDGIPANNDTVLDVQRVPGKPISIFGFDNQLAMMWEYKDESGQSTVYRPMFSRFMQVGDDIHINQSYFADQNYNLTRNGLSMVQFNVVNTESGNIVNYTYDRKILVYPDCYSVPYPFDFRSDHWNVPASSFNTQENPIPVSDFSAVYNSRVFGTNTNAVFASDYNTYAAYNLDTADDVSSANAWWSMTNTNTEADGSFTAMCTYDNHVVLFKKDFMQLVYNNKNPFRVVDVGKFGCVSNKAWTIMNGVLYFASQDKIYAYTGGTPKEISQKLDIENLESCVLGSYNDTVWAQTNHGIFTYKNGVWSKYSSYPARLTPTGDDPYIIRQFATLDFGLVALAEFITTSSATNYYKLLLMDWNIDFLDDAPSTEGWDPEYYSVWHFTTDIMALGKLDVRRIKKVSILCEGEEGATVSVYLLKDGESDPRLFLNRLVGTLTLDSNGIHMLRVLTRQFSSTMHQLYFVGSGYMKIHAAEVKLSWGGDLYVES